MHKIGIISSVIFLLLMAGTGFAQNVSSEYCSDNMTVVHVRHIEIPEAGLNRTFYEPENCQYGCDTGTNACIPSPFLRNLFIGIGIFAVIILVIIVLRIGGHI